MESTSLPFQKGSPTDRRTLAQVSVGCEWLCLFLTLIYSCIAVHDIWHGAAILTSPSWFANGFCVWEMGPLCSHVLCFIFDLWVGWPVVMENWRRLQLAKSERHINIMKLCFGVSCFNIAHGIVHLAIRMKWVELGNQDLGMFFEPWVALRKFALGTVILGVTPYFGYQCGLPASWCVLGHIVTTTMGGFVPAEFAFAWTQLLFNVWICVPRLYAIGVDTEADIAKRVDQGWLFASVAMPGLMLIAFSEQMGCETFYKPLGGHVLFDAATVLANKYFSQVNWQEMDEEDLREGLALIQKSKEAGIPQLAPRLSRGRSLNDLNALSTADPTKPKADTGCAPSLPSKTSLPELPHDSTGAGRMRKRLPPAMTRSSSRD